MADDALKFIPLVPGILIHPKPRRLAALLGIRKSEARLICENFWLFALQVCPIGVMAQLDAEEAAVFAVENVDTWPTDDAGTKAPEPCALLDAMVEAGILDRNESNEVTLHGWGEHAGRARPMSNAERQAKYRATHPKSNERRNAKVIDKVTEKVTESNDGVTKSNGQVNLTEVKLTELKSIKDLTNCGETPNSSTVTPPETASEAPRATIAADGPAEPGNRRKRRRSLPAVELSPEMLALIARWRKPVNKREVAELLEARKAEGATEAEILAGADAYLKSRACDEPKFDKNLESFLGPRLHFRTDWTKRVAAKPIGQHYNPNNHVSREQADEAMRYFNEKAEREGRA